MRWSEIIPNLFDRYRRPILAALLGLYLLGFNGQWRPEPDSALYLTLGRNLAEGRGYTYHGEPHHLAYPGWPWVLAILFRTCGRHAIFVAHLVVLLMGFASLALMYRLIFLYAGRAMAVLMTVGLGISRTFYRYCFELRSDMPFMLGVMMVLAGYEGLSRARQDGTAGRPRKWLDWSLLLAGLIIAACTRPTMWALLASLAMAIAWGMVCGRMNRRWLIALIAIPLCAALFLLADPRRGGAAHPLGDYEDVLLQHISPALLKQNLLQLFEPMASEALFGIDFGKSLHLGAFTLDCVGSLVAIAVGLLIFRQRAFWGLWFLITLLMMILVLARDRYFLPVLPLMIYSWWLCIRWLNYKMPRRWGNAAFLCLFAVGACANTAKDGQLFIEQRHPNVLTAYRDGRYESIDRVGAMIARDVPPGAWVLAPTKFERILTFLSRRNVVERFEAPGIEDSGKTVFALRPVDMVFDDDLSGRLGPAIDSVQGPYDPQPWTLHRVLPRRPASGALGAAR